MDKNNAYKIWYKTRFILFVLFFIIPFLLIAKNDYNKADSIILKVLENRDFYGKYIEEYEANAYIKGDRYVKKKNVLYQYAPPILYLDKRGKNAFIESLVNIHFKAPNYFTQQIIAVNGSRISINDIRKRVMQFLNVNIYNPAIFNNQILIPGVKDVFKYYRFEYISTIDTLNQRIFQIRVIPKIRSQQLISGFFYVADSLWTIYKLNVEGKWEFSKFRIETEFGLPGKDFLLPVETEITFELKLFGNEVINRYYSSFQYTDVKKYNPDKQRKKFNYDMSDYFNVSIDSIPIIKDEKFWEGTRSVPLTPYEESLVEVEREKQKTTNIPNLLKSSWDFSQGAVSPKRFNYNDSRMSYSGLINPFKLAYSKLDGIVYWQEFRYRKLNEEGKELYFNPSLGYLFQRKQVYFRVPIQWMFQPGKMGEIRFIIQNRNQTYNSTFIDMIEKETPDSIHFEDFNLKYYRHYTSGIKAQYEISNGLLLSGGINYDWYVPVKYKSKKENLSDVDISKDVTDLTTDLYQIFLPSIGITWTSHQYYRINGKQKEYIGSNYPTLSAECSWGIKNIWGSNSNYIQLEADILQRIPLGLMNTFQYYFSAGKFLKTNSLYFADFNLFQKRNFPESWDDPIGGVFQLLRGEWYSASHSYVQAHLAYEFPYMLSRMLRSVTGDIMNERIYFSQLYTPILPCYTEIGYGIGNYIGDAGIFVSFVSGKCNSVGATFTFGLGK